MTPEVERAIDEFRQRMYGHLEDQMTGNRHGQPDRELFHMRRQKITDFTKSNESAGRTGGKQNTKE